MGIRESDDENGLADFYIPTGYEDIEQYRAYAEVYAKVQANPGLDLTTEWRRRRWQILQQRRAHEQAESRSLRQRSPARLNIRVPRSLLERVRAVAKHEGVTINTFIVSVVERAVVDARQGP